MTEIEQPEPMERTRPVMVTTIHRGVFFGYTSAPIDIRRDTIVLERARNAIEWSADMRGVFGLASHGPSSTCRIGPAVPVLHLRGVSSITEVAPEAVERWEAAPWRA
jgi:hypothetical protein